MEAGDATWDALQQVASTRRETILRIGGELKDAKDRHRFEECAQLSSALEEQQRALNADLEKVEQREIEALGHYIMLGKLECRLQDAIQKDDFEMCAQLQHDIAEKVNELESFAPSNPVFGNDLMDNSLIPREAESSPEGAANANAQMEDLQMQLTIARSQLEEAGRHSVNQHEAQQAVDTMRAELEAGRQALLFNQHEAQQAADAMRAELEAAEEKIVQLTAENARLKGQLELEQADIGLRGPVEEDFDTISQAAAGFTN